MIDHRLAVPVYAYVSTVLFCYLRNVGALYHACLYTNASIIGVHSKALVFGPRALLEFSMFLSSFMGSWHLR